jgi:choice-of-anchor A domain-containing protein
MIFNFPFPRFTRAGCHLLSTLSVIAVSAVSVQATAINLSEAGNYNLVTWGNATLQNSDIQGTVAAGGNVSFSSYSIGTAANNSAATDPSLVVGGNLTAGNGQVNNGSIYVGGSYSGPGYNLNSAAGSVTQSGMGSSVPFNFAAAQSALTAKSTSYGALAGNGSSVLSSSTLTLTGTDSSLNVFHISAADLAAASTLQINVAANSHVLINVSGTSVSLSNLGIFDSATANNTLFNFYQATTLLLASVGINGTVLSPFADVNFSVGQLNGPLIAKTFTGPGELHVAPFNNQQGSVPDSASTAGLLIAGLGAVVLARKTLGKKLTRN